MKKLALACPHPPTGRCFLCYPGQMITAVTTCMGRLEHLQVTLPYMLEEFDDVIVVDYSCPQKSGEWASSLGARAVWKRDQKYFNASKARNFGARHVKTRSVCFIDADTIVMPGVKSEIKNLLNLSSMVIASRTAKGIDLHDLGGFLAVDIGHFWGVNGYDESLEGYALEDSHIRAKLCLERDLSVRRVSGGSIGVIRHSNELRGKFFKEPIEVGASRNYQKLTQYLKSKGISDWTTDPRTAEVAHRV